jgi:hypothetical protein
VFSLTEKLTKAFQQENAMKQFIEKYKDEIVGVLNGFDRLVFRGSLRRLNYGFWDRQLSATVAKGMEEYLRQNRILFKDYEKHVKKISKRLKLGFERPFREQDLPVMFRDGASFDKDGAA